jgi:ATP/maltotriose-dependent transcriptional regulator MalT
VPPNPFVYGEVVPQAAFVDREEELDRLRRDLDDGQKVFLISPRRYGKSSLIPKCRSSTAEVSGLMWICCEPVSAVDLAPNGLRFR